jgi:hypothetical protein
LIILKKHKHILQLNCRISVEICGIDITSLHVNHYMTIPLLAEMQSERTNKDRVGVFYCLGKL